MALKKSTTTILLSSLFALILVSCGNGSFYKEYKSIPVETGWKASEKLSFDVNIDDTVSLNNVYINVRNDDSYSYRNLQMVLHTTYPDGKKKSDTVECLLADEQNHWLGNGAGDLWDNRIFFKKNTRFPIKGKYQFSFEQIMRYGTKNTIDPLYLILDVGIEIEKAK